MEVYEKIKEESIKMDCFWERVCSDVMVETLRGRA